MSFSDPKTPNATEMILFLIGTDGLDGKTREELQGDPMLKVVAQACNQTLEEIVTLTVQILSDRKSGKSYR